ncbi:MAG: zinc ribbon domain-containing protein [Chloroflexi bacterium]|nr:zinc ribbon domain-containing protein [Chloroflexota bacterium]
MERTRRGDGGTRVETTGVYEMLWDCEFCGTKKLLGVTHRFCPNCGSPQNAEKRYFPKPGEEIALENHVYHGVDWICPSCGQANSANANFCGSCGSDKTGAKTASLRDDPSKAMAAGTAGAVGTGANAIADGFQARDLAQERFDADMQRIQTEEKIVARNRPIFLGLRRKELSIIGVVTFLVTSIVAGVFAFTYKKTENLVVSGHQWERIIHIDEFKQVDETQDCVNMPSDAYDVSRHTETRTRKVADGQTCREECNTQRVDQGDGSFRSERVCHDVCTTKYRDERYTVDVCNYSIDRWKDGRDVKANGKSSSPEPYWPDYTLASGSGSRNLGQEKVDSREENYILLFERDNGEQAKCEYDSMSVWNQFTDNQAVRMDFNLLGKPVCDTLKAKN